MNTIRKALLLVLLTTTAKVCASEFNSMIPQALDKILEQHFVRHSVKFEIIFNSNAIEALGRFLKLIKEKKSIRLVKVDDGDKRLYQLEHSAILIFDSFKNYQI